MEKKRTIGLEDVFRTYKNLYKDDVCPNIFWTVEKLNDDHTDDHTTEIYQCDTMEEAKKKFCDLAHNGIPCTDLSVYLKITY